MSDLTIFVNTHDSCRDIWKLFYGQLKKHWPTHPDVIAACNVRENDWPYHYGGYVDYFAAKQFTSQYLMGLCAVETPYVLTMQEDMILYGDVPELTSRIRPGDDVDCLRLIFSGPQLAYSMQASIWHTSSLKALYAGFDADTPWMAEIKGNEMMKMFGMKTNIVSEPDGPKRGRDHYDNPWFPYTATALVRGVWNAEYKAELEPLHAEYHIDAEKRGWTECRS